MFRRRPAKEKSRAWFLSSKLQQTKTSVQRTSARAHAGARRTTKARGTRECADPSALSNVGALQLNRKWGSHTSDGRVFHYQLSMRFTWMKSDCKESKTSMTPAPMAQTPPPPPPPSTKEKKSLKNIYH